jgi:hypothetical protein
MLAQYEIASWRHRAVVLEGGHDISPAIMWNGSTLWEKPPIHRHACLSDDEGIARDGNYALK